jgi:hypothetical protein
VMADRRSRVDGAHDRQRRVRLSAVGRRVTCRARLAFGDPCEGRRSTMEGCVGPSGRD